MRGKGPGLLWACVVLAAATVAATADPVAFTLETKDFSELGSTGAATAAVVSDYAYGANFSGDVTSRAYTLDDGDYLYLYQVDNQGPSALEVLGVQPFRGLLEGGRLTGGEPSDFLTGGYVPAGQSYDADLSEPLVSYQYPAYAGAHLPAGEHTVVLYLISPYAPEMGEAYVIDGGTATVEAWVPVPEPATGGLLALGAGLGLLRRRRR